MNPFDVYSAASRWPNRLALVTPEFDLTYTQLRDLSQHAWEALTRSIGRPDPHRPVAWIAKPTPQGVALACALWARGVPLCPIHPAATRIERDAQLAVVQPQAFIDETWSLHDAAPSTGRLKQETTGPDSHPFAVIFTSGSTAAARPVVLSRRAFAVAAQASATRLGWQDGDRWLLTLPLAHVGGLSILTRCIQAGRTAVLPPADCDFQELILFARQRSVTHISLVPTQLHRWVESDEIGAWPTLRVVLVGGAATAPQLFDAAVARGLPILRTYGMTETCSQVATQQPGSQSRGDGDCGEPLPGYEVRVDPDSGVLLIRCSALLSGYWPDSPPELDHNGWLRTQDVGAVDSIGHVHVLGRADTTVISGGENIDLREVEAVMQRCDGVRLACAIGIPNAVWGVTVGVLLEPLPGRRISAADLQTHAARHLARHKLPRRWCLVDRLPLTHSGKLDRDGAAAAPWSWQTLSYLVDPPDR